MSLHSFPHPSLALPLLLCLLLVCLATHHPRPILAQGTDVHSLRGVVENGTGGGEVPSGLPVTLHAVDPLEGRVASYNAISNAEGRFIFENVSRVDGGSYVLVTDYDGMRYSEIVETADLEDSVTLTIYEITKDIGVIEVRRQAMIIADVDDKRRQISALEVLRVSNTSDRTLLPELANITNPADISFLRFSLPTDATDLSVQSTLPGGDIVPMGTGFAVTAPVLPGDHEITYSYRFPYESDSVAFNQRLIQGAETYQVLAPLALSQIQVTPLEPRPRIDVGGTPYLVWEASQVPPGRGVALRISQLPQPGLSTILIQSISGTELWLAIIPVLLAVGLGILLLWAWFRAPKTAPSVAGMSGDDVSHRQSLIQAIAVLDDRFEGGHLTEEEYGSRREELMGRLKQLSPSSQGS
ncbi:MAG: hypothetical protein OXI91_09930 [Chloroflexota bacterium]|nr:hypothetical protein [Chloroflexota bacterium]